MLLLPSFHAYLQWRRPHLGCPGNFKLALGLGNCVQIVRASCWGAVLVWDSVDCKQNHDNNVKLRHNASLSIKLDKPTALQVWNIQFRTIRTRHSSPWPGMLASLTSHTWATLGSWLRHGIPGITLPFWVPIHSSLTAKQIPAPNKRTNHFTNQQLA